MLDDREREDNTITDNDDSNLDDIVVDLDELVVITEGTEIEETKERSDESDDNGEN